MFKPKSEMVKEILVSLKPKKKAEEESEMPPSEGEEDEGEDKERAAEAFHRVRLASAQLVTGFDGMVVYF